MLGLSLFANSLLIPYDISFGHEGDPPVYWRVIDVFVVIVNFLDIFVHVNTSIKKKYSLDFSSSLLILY